MLVKIPQSLVLSEIIMQAAGRMLMNDENELVSRVTPDWPRFGSVLEIPLGVVFL